jgi:alpha-tubulin suppressor-like RCC1 family protein
MPGYFTSPEGDLEQIFVDDYAMIDQYAKTGSLWSWGRGTLGRLGNNNAAAQSSPVQTISGGTNWKLINCGYEYTAAIKTDGTLWLWGQNYNGQLGNNNATAQSSPVQTSVQGTNWQLVSCGRYATAAIKTDGTLWTWGGNAHGQLGTNNTLSKSSPVQTVSGGTNWKSVSCGLAYTAAVKTDGTLWLWGANAQGQLGNNTAIGRSSPVQTVSGGTNWKSVSCGADFTAAIKTDGTLWLWGYNNYGQLGNNTTTRLSSPVQTVAGGTNWKNVSGGLHITAAIKTDGTLWTWGLNSYGQLGDNTTLYRSSPVQTVSGGTNWKSVSCSFGTVAIKTDGTLWTWGRNNYGQLGNNTTINRSSPVQTVNGGTNWKNCSNYHEHTAAIHFYDAGNLYPSA